MKSRQEAAETDLQDDLVCALYQFWKEFYDTSFRQNGTSDIVKKIVDRAPSLRLAFERGMNAHIAADGIFQNRGTDILDKLDQDDLKSCDRYELIELDALRHQKSEEIASYLYGLVPNFSSLQKYTLGRVIIWIYLWCNNQQALKTFERLCRLRALGRLPVFRPFREGGRK